MAQEVRATAQEVNAAPQVAANVQKPVQAASRTAGRRAAPKAGGQYFIEFRSRYALSYGHTFVVHGRLNARGEIGPVAANMVAGLHPAGEGPELWSVGHVVAVPSETGPSDGDLEEKYVSARFRINLTETEYNKVSEFIRQKQANSPLWHAVLYNCNSFVADIATFMGLRTPSSTMMYPADFINNLREINREEQGSPSTASMPTLN